MCNIFPEKEQRKPIKVKNKFTYSHANTPLVQSERAYNPVSYSLVQLTSQYCFVFVLGLALRHIGVNFIMKKPQFRWPNPISCVFLNCVFSAGTI